MHSQDAPRFAREKAERGADLNSHPPTPFRCADRDGRWFDGLYTRE